MIHAATDEKSRPQTLRNRTGRKEAFSDGIAITLHVLEIRVPSGAENDVESAGRRVAHSMKADCFRTHPGLTASPGDERRSTSPGVTAGLDAIDAS